MADALKMVYEQDAPLEPLKGKTVAVIGFGSQGHAHSLNLRDSGVKVVVANRRDSANGRLARACRARGGSVRCPASIFRRLLTDG